MPVHYCAHRVELAIKSVSTSIEFFKSLEDTLVQVYKLHHNSTLCWSELQQVGEVLQVEDYKPEKLVHVGTCTSE